MGERFFRQVIGALHEAQATGLVSDKGRDVLGGLSGRATVGALQRFVGLFGGRSDICYLEVGVFQGLSLLSVAIEHPDFACFGVDNFSILDPKGENLGIVQERTARLKATNATLINMDFEAALERIDTLTGGRKVAVYFIDGAHDYRSQLMGLLLIKPHLAEQAVIVVDDANYPDVRQSTRDFLVSHPEFKMVFEAYSAGHPANLDDATRTACEAGFLNGVNVLVKDVGRVLPEMLPPVPASRHLYVNEWLVHRHRLAELAPEAMDLAQAALDGGDLAPATARIRAVYAADKASFDARFPDRNVHSAELTPGRFTDWG
ncbi:MAG: class I SAM-dependent methyltransferase [Magnetospirillum sp.]|nr:class I SAM-dependent methyltransferase [Magnetospirillum sp.]